MTRTQRINRQDTERETMLGSTLSQIASLLSWFLFAIFISILIEWIGMLAGWWDKTHARHMLTEEIGYLSHIDQNQLLKLHPAQLAGQAITWVNEAYSFIGIPKALSILSQYMGWLAIALSSAIDITYTLVIRLAVVLLALPAFILWGLLGLVDGLVARDIRKACGGVESSFVYHRVKGWMKPAIGLSSGLYLTLPFSINPALFFIVPQLLFFTFVYYTASTFKKFI
jgi:integrating conjugative element membrane protein (TIGR03747 family)